jgi:beta-mannosidase
VTEFGAQAVPESAEFMEPDRWPKLDWDRLFAHHACQKRVFDRVVPPADFATFDEWRAATQEYQAALVQLQVEDLRRLKYAPTGGFCHFCFADGHPAVTWSVLDHDRGEKLGFSALRDACRPVLPMLEPRNGLVHVASERRDDLAGAVVEVTADGDALARFSGDIAADAVTYVGRVDLDGARKASVTLEHPAIGRVENAYHDALLASVREEARG